MNGMKPHLVYANESGRGALAVETLKRLYDRKRLASQVEFKHLESFAMARKLSLRAGFAGAL